MASRPIVGRATLGKNSNCYAKCFARTTYCKAQIQNVFDVLEQDLAQDLHAVQEQNTAYQQQVEQLQQQLKQLQQQLQQAQQQAQQQQLQQQAVQASSGYDIDRLQRARAQKEKQIDRLQSNFQLATSELNGLQAACSSKDAHIAALGANCSSNVTHIAALEADNQQLRQDLAAAMQTYQQVLEKAERCDEALISWAACRNELADKIYECDKLQQQMFESEEVCKQLEQQHKQHCEHFALLSLPTINQHNSSSSSKGYWAGLEQLQQPAAMAPTLGVSSDGADSCCVSVDGCAADAIITGSSTACSEYSCGALSMPSNQSDVSDYHTTKDEQQFYLELKCGDHFSACLAAAMRSAGYCDVTAAAVNAGISTVQTAMEAAVDSPSAVAFVTFASVVQLVEHSLDGDDCVTSAEEAQQAATVATERLFSLTSSGSIFAADPAAFAATAAVMAAHGPMLDPQCMQQIVQCISALMREHASDEAALFAGVRAVGERASWAVTGSGTQSS